MSRPNRYPYTLNQWEEETSIVRTFDGEEYLRIKTLKNRITREMVLAKYQETPK